MLVHLACVEGLTATTHNKAVGLVRTAGIDDAVIDPGALPSSFGSRFLSHSMEANVPERRNGGASDAAHEFSPIHVLSILSSRRGEIERLTVRTAVGPEGDFPAR